jgi:anti-sigma B factor antagonist
MIPAGVSVEAIPTGAEQLQKPFEIDVQEREGSVLVRLSGEIDLAAVEAIETELLPLEKRFPTVILDLRGVTFLDSTGLRAIVSADARARKNGSELKIVRGPEQVQKILYLSGLDKILPLVDPEEL